MSANSSIAQLPPASDPVPGRPAEAIQPPDPTSPSATHRILLIDDTAAIHADFLKILTEEDVASLDRTEAELFGSSVSPTLRSRFTVDSAYQGQEGLKLVQQALQEGRPYALAFVDVRMPPGWDGIETIAQLWAVDPDLQIAISTAYSDYSWAEIAHRFGATDSLLFLKKPFDNIEVLQLTHALTKKWSLNRHSKRHVEALDETVRRRTEELRAANHGLTLEIAERKRAQTRIAAFSKLGLQLSATKTARAAAEIIVEIADQLIGWDSCWLDLYSAEDDVLKHILYEDLIDGKRQACPPDDDHRPPSAMVRKTITEGAQLILKENPGQRQPGTLPFGDTARPSASILVVPIRNKADVIGVLSIQSYRSHAYDHASLETLLALAHHCAGALDRIQTAEALHTTQEQLRQSQKLEAIGQLAGGIAHDFNNLLTVIRGNNELVLMSPDELPPLAVECLNQAVSAADRAAKLTRQLLAFSRKQVMQSQPLNLSEVVTNMTRMLKRVIGEHIQLDCRCGPGLPLTQADVGMLEQVLVNLVVNARDAMPRGGQLVISTAAVQFDALAARSHEEGRPGRFVTLAVADTGSGIAPEHLPHIFEPFFTTKDVGKGTGLGLATVYGIVKQHRGWIEVSTQPGVGSTFTLFLPAMETVAPQLSHAANVAQPTGGRETILLVEDEDSVRLLTRRLLEKFGYTILEASSARAALDLCRSCSANIDLLLTDIIMPQGITGRELAEQLRAGNPKLKVVYTSGYSGDVLGHDPEFVRQSNSRFVAKPCSPQVLLETLRQYLDAPVS